MDMPALPNKAPAGLSSTVLSGLFRALDGLRNWRALVVLLGCTAAGVLVAGLLLALGKFSGAAPLGGLMLFVAWSVGLNSAGVLLMDQARGRPSRRLADALAPGLACMPQFIVLAAAFTLAGLLVFVAAALVFMICKVPFIGPVLFVAALPLSVVAGGLMACAGSLGLMLMLPAIWDGVALGRALAQAGSMVRERWVEAILLAGAVSLLAMIVALVVCGVLGAGLLPTLVLAGAIVGGGEGLPALGGMAAGMSGSYAIAGAIGAGLLCALAGSLVGLVYLLGLNLAYLRLTGRPETRSTEAAPRVSSWSKVGHWAPPGSPLATPPAVRAVATPAPDPFPATVFERTEIRVTRPAAVPAAWSVSSPIAMSCPQCLSDVERGDTYCGGCGHKLR